MILAFYGGAVNERFAQSAAGAAGIRSAP